MARYFSFSVVALALGITTTVEAFLSSDTCTAKISHGRAALGMSSIVGEGTQNLLVDKTLYIEFQGYLSNHVKHAIVALDKLEAPAERIQGYWDTYTKLTPYNLQVEKVPTAWDQVQPIATKEEWKNLRGKKEKWQEMCSFLELEKMNRFGGDTNLLVKEFAPDLLGGMSGALTHGIIHLGWGIDGKSDWMTLEGLAYLNFCHLGVDDSQFKDNAVEENTPLESMLRIANEYSSKNLKATWIEDSKAKLGEEFHPELIPSGFQWNLAKVLANPHPVALEHPTWLSKDPLEQIWKNLYQTGTLIYLATRGKDDHGNFLILHSITSLWALEKVCRVIDDPQVERKALKQYYGNLVCLLAAGNAGFPTVDMLQTTQTEFPWTKLDDDKAGFDWETTVAAGIQETEEHNIKLVYVMKALWDRYNQWPGFSEAAKCFVLTPNIGPSKTEYKA